jgi:anti-anti-sigma factor
MMFMRKVLTKDEAVLEIQGPLAGEAAGEFQRHMQELTAESFTVVTLNLAGVTVIGSSAIGKILLFRKKLDEEGRTLRIRGCSEALFKTLQMIKFDSLMSIDRAPP